MLILTRLRQAVSDAGAIVRLIIGVLSQCVIREFSDRVIRPSYPTELSECVTQASYPSVLSECIIRVSYPSLRDGHFSQSHLSALLLHSHTTLSTQVFRGSESLQIKHSLIAAHRLSHAVIMTAD